LDTYWKNFLRHYEQINEDPMDDKLGRRMRKVGSNPISRYLANDWLQNRVFERL
jgi:hypothetical protein